MTRITLASASKTRAEMLTNAGVTLDVAPSGVDEAAIKTALEAQGVGARDVADALAEAKAVKISLKQPGLVLGADSILELDGRLYDKPETLEDACRHLVTLRGRSHRLHSAAVIAEGGAPLWRYVATATLHMRNFSEAFLDAYVAAEGEALLSSVGCYRLEGLGVQLFDTIEGDYFAILGLPLLPVLHQLRIHGAISV